MAIIVAISSAFFSGLARADEASVRHEAVALAQDAAAAYEQGRNQEALQKFEAAYRLFQAPQLLLNLVRIQLKLGHCDEAFDYAQKFVAAQPSGSAAANAELERVTTGCSAAEIVSDPTGASIEIDGERRGWSITPWTGRLTVGDHAVVAHLASFPDRKATLTVAAGAMGRLHLRFAQPAPPQPAPPQPAPPPPALVPIVELKPPPPPPSEETQAPEAAIAPAPQKPIASNRAVKTLGWVAVGLGGAALITGIGLYAAGRSQQTAIHTKPDTAGGNAALSELNAANGEVTGSTAPFIVGAVLGLGGLGVEFLF